MNTTAFRTIVIVDLVLFGSAAGVGGAGAPQETQMDAGERIRLFRRE